MKLWKVDVVFRLGSVRAVEMFDGIEAIGPEEAADAARNLVKQSCPSANGFYLANVGSPGPRKNIFLEHTVFFGRGMMS